MNERMIKRALNSKLTKWVNSIGNKALQNAIKKDAIVTGGALVSLLTNADVNDYDVYFKTKETAIDVATYYAEKLKKGITVKEKGDRVSLFISSSGVVKKKTDEEYAPIYATSNAITLNNDIQIVLRFWGEMEELHESFDFEHCTCGYIWGDDELYLPNKALLAILNKRLVFRNSLYPLSAIIRTKKFIERGWRINAGQYVKMCFGLNQLDLNDFEVLTDQLIGVDMAYFEGVLKAVQEKDAEKVDAAYLMQKIDEIFG